MVGEGVETAAELETLEQLGIDAVQGFLLGRPRTGDAAWSSPPVVPAACWTGAVGPREAREVARLIYSALTSLDGYVADATGDFDWAAPDEEVHAPSTTSSAPSARTSTAGACTT